MKKKTQIYKPLFLARSVSFEKVWEFLTRTTRENQCLVSYEVLLLVSKERRFPKSSKRFFEMSCGTRGPSLLLFLRATSCCGTLTHELKWPSSRPTSDSSRLGFGAGKQGVTGGEGRPFSKRRGKNGTVRSVRFS